VLWLYYDKQVKEYLMLCGDPATAAAVVISGGPMGLSEVPFSLVLNGDGLVFGDIHERDSKDRKESFI
jgi:hypothetical protein